jgi:hypothetical protein
MFGPEFAQRDDLPELNEAWLTVSICSATPCPAFSSEEHSARVTPSLISIRVWSTYTAWSCSRSTVRPQSPATRSMTRRTQPQLLLAGMGDARNWELSSRL